MERMLELADNGAINMQSIIGKCPHCGGDIRVGTRAFNCSNYSNQQAPCNFAIWRNIGGHQLSLTEARDICEKEIDVYKRQQVVDKQSQERALKLHAPKAEQSKGLKL